MRPELVRATELLQSNDSASINEAIGLLQHTVYSFSMKVCGHPEDAEDTTQEVFVRSLPHLSKITEPRALAVWLYTVARNRCWRMRRKGAHSPAHTVSLNDLMPDESELSDLLRDSGPTPEAQVSGAEQSQRLQQAVMSIPAQYRLVLVLHDMEDLDTDQIAQVLGIKPGTVRVRLHRARLHVRRALAATEDRAQPHSAISPTLETRSPKASPAAARSRECREIFGNLSEYLDGRIESPACDQMRKHIEGCRPCVAFIQDLRQAIDRCRETGSHCGPEVGRRLRALLTEEYLRMVGLPGPEKKIGASVTNFSFMSFFW